MSNHILSDIATDYTTMQQRLRIIPLFTLLILAIACGGSDKTWQKDANGVYQVEVKVLGSGMSDMRFEPARLTLPAQSKVKLTLNNAMKSTDIYQNWVLVNMGTGQEVVNDAIAAGSNNNYVPSGRNVIAATELAASGSSVSVEFTTPASGSFNYISTYPGNFPKLIGKLSIE